MLDCEKKYLLRLMLAELPNNITKDIIHNSNSMRTDYQKGGFNLNKKDDLHIKRRIDIILKGINNNDIESFFNLWLSLQNDYQEILKTYFESNKDDENDIPENDDMSIENEVFSKLYTSIRNNNHLLYFLNLSKISFSDEQRNKLRIKFYEMSQDEVEVIAHKLSNDDFDLTKKYQILLNEKEKLHKQIDKIKKEKDELDIKLKKEKEHVKHLRVNITNLEEIKERKEAIESKIDELNNTIAKLNQDNKEYEKNIKNLNHKLECERKESYQKFLDEKKVDIDKELASYKEEITNKISNLNNKVEDLDETKKSLVGLNKKLRDELEDYIINGEKWKNALRPSRLGILSEYEDFDNYFTQLNKIHLQDINKLTNNGINRFFRNNKTITNKFKKNVFHYNIDSSFISFERFNNGKGFFQSIEIPLTFIEFIEITKMFDNVYFSMIIYNANRAPIECYFSNVINAVQEDIAITYEEKVIKIPDNIVFFFQINDDEYSAKLSENYSKLIKSIV